MDEGCIIWNWPDSDNPTKKGPGFHPIPKDTKWMEAFDGATAVDANGQFIFFQVGKPNGYSDCHGNPRFFFIFRGLQPIFFLA